MELEDHNVITPDFVPGFTLPEHLSHVVSAEEYFNRALQERFASEISYRSSHPQLLQVTEAHVNQMRERYILAALQASTARAYLDTNFDQVVAHWTEASSPKVKEACQTILADALETDPEFALLFSNGDPVEFHAVCHNTVLWLGSWIKNEKIYH